MLGCREQQSTASSGKAKTSIFKVMVATVESRAFSDRIEALGTVRALEATNISSSVTERVQSLHFEDGDVVKKGDLLVRLEDAEEVASLNVAKAQLAEQEREIQRLGDLVKEGAVSEVKLEEYRTRRDVADQRIAEAEALIADRKIKAPFDGVLGFRRISDGALVSPGDLIVTLDILDPIKLDFTVPETFLSDIHPGLKIIAWAEPFPQTEFSGQVTQIDSRVNPITRSITVRAEIPNPGNRLRPGMLMTTELEKNQRNSLSAPERSIVSVQSNHYVFVVQTGDPSQLTVARSTVEIGQRVPGFVEIVSGLEKGAQIVSDGLISLVDGAKVEVVGQFDKPSAPYRPADMAK
jgi:membrane fusion protein (multidrug efflux system)